MAIVYLKPPHVIVIIRHINSIGSLNFFIHPTPIILKSRGPPPPTSAAPFRVKGCADSLLAEYSRRVEPFWCLWSL